MRATSPPAPFADLHLAHAFRVGSEYRSACPRCGGDENADRFIMWETSEATGAPLGWCRQCDYKYHPGRENGNTAISDEERAFFAAERARRYEQEQHEQAERREMFRQVPWWETFHENLDKYPRAVQLWRERYGIGEWALRYYRLGYCPEFRYQHDGQECVTDSLTIPIFQPATEYKAVNLRHRLLAPDAKGGKYRPHTGGLGQPVFYANLNRVPESLPYALVVEGEIKAAVIWERAVAPMLKGSAERRTEWFVHNVQVIGITGTSLNPANLAALQHIERLFVAFDPDANERSGRKPSLAERFAAGFEKSTRRVLTLPGKPDDLMVDGSLTIADLVEFMKWGRVI